ncbi:hypothetical protein Tco_0720209 [Tanacetum coccineum]
MEGVINASGQWKYSFYTGQQFTTPKEAKDLVYLHSIESRRNLKLYKNDSVRIRARCKGKVLVFTMSQGTGPTGPNSRMEAGPSGSSGPTTRSKKRKNTGTNDGSQASLSFLDAHDKGDLCPWVLDYVVELQSTNPNTTVKIAVERNTDPSLPTRVFQRIYVCLGALKLGFRACGRDLLGLDGAFMKGPFPGPIFAETKSSWCWFLQCLGDDIDLHPNSNFTFISDRQKGIIPAIKTVYPSAEHIYCLRHIHENMKQGWCGQAYKDLLWRAASATNVRDFEKCMLELKTMNPKAHEWLNKIPAEHWARSHFSGRAKSDLCSTHRVIDKCTGPLTPTATRIMESIKKEAHLMKVQWNEANKYQVSCSLGDQCIVDVVSGTTLRNLGDNNAEGSGSASRQAQQTKPAVGQDGLGGSGAPAVIGLSAAAGEGGAGDPGGAGVASQVSQTRNADGREMGDGVPTQSSAAGGASEWSFL